jgi:hypothetical protein
MKDYNLQDTEIDRFENYLDELQKVWEANSDYFEKLRASTGIRSTQIMSILALNIIEGRQPLDPEF